MAEKSKVSTTPTTMIQLTNTDVEKRLPFKPQPELGGLCIGELVDVEIKEIEAPLIDSQGVASTWDYAGCKLYHLHLLFRQDTSKVNPKPRYHKEEFSVISSIKKDGTPVENGVFVSLYTQMYEKLRHITNAFNGLAAYKDDEDCPGIDPAAAPQIRANQFKAIFEYFANILKGTGEIPLYKGVKLYIKVVAEYTKGTYYTFPTYVSKGFIERAISGQAPTIYIEPSDSIELKAKVKGKAEKALSGQADSEIDTEAQNVLDKYGV